MSRNHKPFFHELFGIYKIQRFLFMELGLILIASALTPFFEMQIAGSNIHTFADGFWFSLVTVSSVGFGDFYPVSFGGRVLATVLMFSGVALYSTIVALIGAFYARRRSLRDTEKIYNEVEEIGKKVNQIEKKLEFLIKSKHE
ncbi:two pore domain potassium channel family protein [Candidatus Beckwithbacteria bacterium]|nr:two pore domain potassium channel family protein [Candidatus Beckwithbacteria bacterium]